MSEARTPKKNETTTDRGLGLTTHRIDWLTGHCDWSTHARRSFFLKRFSSLKRQISPLFIDFISFLSLSFLISFLDLSYEKIYLFSLKISFFHPSSSLFFLDFIRSFPLLQVLELSRATINRLRELRLVNSMNKGFLFLQVLLLLKQLKQEPRIKPTQIHWGGRKA